MKLNDRRLLSFFRFADRDPLQPDHGSNSTHWIHDPDRVYFDSQLFDQVNSYFEKEARTVNDFVETSSSGSILHVFHTDSGTGLTLPVSPNVLSTSKAFTVEFWVAFAEFASGNFSILGVPDQPWDQGFSIAGVMTPSMATVACVLDTGLTSNMKREMCYADTKFCKTIKSTNTWYHLFCSRVDIEKVSKVVASSENTDNTNSGQTEGQTEAQETICVNKVKGMMGLDEDVTSVTASDDLVLKANMEDLFKAGEVVLGTKYNAETATRTASFNGYVREVRFWSHDVEVGFLKYKKRERLNPMAYRGLVGYWPFFGGSLDNFVDLSGHNIDFVRKRTGNPNPNGGGVEWVQTANLPSFPYCSEGYIYHPRNSTCILRKSHTALYINETDSCSCEIAATGKQYSGEAVTLSIWTYLREKAANGAVLIGIAGIATIQSVTGNLGGYIEGIEVLALATIAPTGKWFHSALTATKSSKKVCLFSDGEVAETTTTGTLNIGTTLSGFVIGKGIVGFVREAKVWSVDLVSNGGYTAIMQEKFQ